MKRILAFFLATLLLLFSGSVAFADSSKTGERAVIGADISETDIDAVYNAFGIERGSVPEMKMTNAIERSYLEGFVDSSVIGTKSISCVYVKISDDNSGLDVSTSNVTWCTPEMYVSALATAGITDAKIVVAAPIQVSGTAALAGIYMAYEDITGQKLDDTAKLVSTQELTITGSLAEEIGSMDSTSIVNDLKDMLAETQTMTDDQLRQEIVQIAATYNVTLNDTQIQQLISLCRSLEGLNDADLLAKVQEVQGTLNKVSSATTTIKNFTQTVAKVVSSVSEFFAKIKDIIGM